MTYQPQQNKSALKASSPVPADKKAQPDGLKNEANKNPQRGNPKSDGESCGTGACSTEKQSSKPKADEDEEKE